MYVDLWNFKFGMKLIRAYSQKYFNEEIIFFKRSIFYAESNIFNDVLQFPPKNCTACIFYIYFIISGPVTSSSLRHSKGR